MEVSKWREKGRKVIIDLEEKKRKWKWGKWDVRKKRNKRKKGEGKTEKSQKILKSWDEKENQKLVLEMTIRISD